MKYKYKRYQLFNKKLDIPKKIKTRVYNGQISLDDFYKYELDDKIPTSCIAIPDRDVIDRFGVEICKSLDWELYNTLPVVPLLMSIDPQTEDINVALYELVKNEISPSNYPSRMKEIYSNRLFDISQDEDKKIKLIKESFNNGELYLEEIIYNWDLLNNKDLSYCLLKDYRNQEKNITDSDLKQIMKEHKNLATLARVIHKLDRNDIHTFISDIIAKKSNEERHEYIKQCTDNLLKTLSYGECTDDVYNAIFQYSSMEDCLKRVDDHYTPNIINELKRLPKDYISSMPIPFDLFLFSYSALSFIGYYGLKNIVDFDNECGHFFTKNNCEMLRLMYDMYLHYAGNVHDPNRTIFTRKSYDEPYTKDEFYEAMRRMIKYGPTNENFKGIMPEYREITGEFRVKNAELFISEQAPEELQNLFYQRKISPEIIQSHPEWKQLLQGKDIGSVCDIGVSAFVRKCIQLGFDNDKVFELFDRYGSYLAICQINLNNINSNNIGELDNVIRQQMVEAISVKGVRYDESARALLAQEHPELFLDENAPDELKEAFYNYTSNTPLTFEFLRQHKDWLPHIEGKNVLLSLKKRNIGIRGLEQLFEKYGEQEALRIGMKNPESVMQMLRENKFDVLSDWYDKLHFVPHHVVMKEFPFEQADKFVASGKKWSQLAKIERHNINEDSKATLLKASMCFGVFDNDMDGFNKTMQLFSDVPKTLSSQDMQRMIDFIQKQISSLGDNPNPNMVEDYNKQLALIQQCYEQSKEGIFSLKINSQQNKNAVQTLRSIMEEANVSTILTPDKAHKLFGGFEMKYEPDFRDFILKNMNTILSSDEYIAYISSMQKQWINIKALNSNRVLTLDLAMAFVKSNNYENVQVGNQKLSEISSMAGYDQRSFNTLQQIYNYGKLRTFSSIPRVHTQNGEYTYEILRLDDPLAIAIGTLTDCCQELGNAAETSMAHSMVDKNGRVFVIKDEAGNIVAQSWVWRNRNVLCFDNIEIPAKAFTRAERGASSREHFTDTVFALYQQAGEELIAKDEEEFKKLLDEGKITEEQYEALKLGKVTVGTGYNDIADSLRRNSQLDMSIVARPLNFVSPVSLNHGLYTFDSRTQYVISGEQDVLTSTYETPTIYSDEFVIHDNENTKQQDLLMLQKLELATRGDSYFGRTQSDETEKIVSNIAYNYGLNPETTMIIMNANFAIIYDTTSEEVIVGDVLYNTSFDNNGQQIDISDKVAMQIRMAIEQIGVEDKKFNISRLSQEQLEMYNKAMNLETEIDEERGLSHGAR